MPTSQAHRRRAFLAALCAGMVLPAAVAAQTAQPSANGEDAVRVVRRRLREHERAWRLLMRLRLPRVPDKPTVPLRFLLTQREDFQPGNGGEPRRVPVEPPQTIVLERTVDVRDIQGKRGVRARAELLLERTEGFRAGVWLLVVEGPDGPLGDAVRLTLEGVNGASKPDGGTEGGT